jgi:hypothetical protein
MEVENWEVLVELFAKAHSGGDVETLEAIKNLGISGFYNLDDLGGIFLKYGPGFTKWDEMITDALENDRRAKEYCDKIDELTAWQELFRRAFNIGDQKTLILLAKIPISGRTFFGKGLEKYNNQTTPEFFKDVTSNRQAWSAFSTKFYKAFYTGDVKTLSILKSLAFMKRFNNFADLGPQFEKYDSNSLGWDLLVSDAIQNKPDLQ